MGLQLVPVEDGVYKTRNALLLSDSTTQASTLCCVDTPYAAQSICCEHSVICAGSTDPDESSKEREHLRYLLTDVPLRVGRRVYLIVDLSATDGHIYKRQIKYGSRSASLLAHNMFPS